MTHRQRRGEERLDPNLTPLLDIVLQLITFFMMLIHFGTQIEGATPDISLPITPAALPGGDLALDRLVVSLDKQGRLLINDVPRLGAEARKWWADQASTRRAGQILPAGPLKDLSTHVVIRADRAVAYGRVRNALEEAQAVGFVHFSLIVLREEP